MYIKHCSVKIAIYLYLAKHTGLYPLVAKGIRLAAQGKDPLEGQKHMCGMGNVFNYHSTGFPDLDELMREPQPLIFIMELIWVGLQTCTHAYTHRIYNPTVKSSDSTYYNFFAAAQTIQVQAKQNAGNLYVKHLFSA